VPSHALPKHNPLSKSWSKSFCKFEADNDMPTTTDRKRPTDNDRTNDNDRPTTTERQRQIDNDRPTTTDHQRQTDNDRPTTTDQQRQTDNAITFLLSIVRHCRLQWGRQR
jgi:hypothetical protein